MPIADGKIPYNLESLLTADEQAYIKKQQAIEEENRERQWQKNKGDKALTATALIKKYQDNEPIKALLAE